jgi:hypothetical protein
MTRTRATACAVALVLSATAATADTVPYPVPRTDDNYLPVPAHAIGEACGTLKYRDEIIQCIRSEEVHHQYVSRTCGYLSIEEQKEARVFLSAKGSNYERFYSDLASYLEDKMRQRKHLD